MPRRTYSVNMNAKVLELKSTGSVFLNMNSFKFKQLSPQKTSKVVICFNLQKNFLNSFSVTK